MAITNPVRGGQINDAGYWTAASNWNGNQMPGMPPGFTSGATTVPGDLGGVDSQGKPTGLYGFQYLAPLPQSFTGIPYNQGDTSGNLVNGGYNNLMDQTQDSLRMPSTYTQGWPWNNGAGRYAYGSGQPYNPNAGGKAPWPVHPGSAPPPGGAPQAGPPQGGQQAPGSIPGYPFPVPPTPGNLNQGSDFPSQQLDPSTLPHNPWTFPPAVPMPKQPPRLGGSSSDVAPKMASAGGMPSAADLAFMNLFHGSGSNGPVLQQSDYDFLAGNVLPYDIAGVSPALRQQARAEAVAQDPKAAALWDRTPGISINLANGHYTANGNSRHRR